MTILASPAAPPGRNNRLSMPLEWPVQSLRSTGKPRLAKVVPLAPRIAQAGAKSAAAGKPARKAIL